jgi:iron complex transport system permease protein
MWAGSGPSHLRLADDGGIGLRLRTDRLGLIVPHGARLIFGPDHRVLIPSSALIGASFLIASDTLARTLLAPVELPVGVITAAFGGPFFIYLLKTRKAVKTL